MFTLGLCRLYFDWGVFKWRFSQSLKVSKAHLKLRLLRHTYIRQVRPTEAHLKTMVAFARMTFRMSAVKSA